jgi:hypothetical protein
MIIPKIVGGKEDIILNGHIVPLDDTGKAIRPFKEQLDTELLSGLLHGFENRRKWNEATSLRAAFLQYTYGNSLNLETLLAASARTGLTPRLGSQIRVGRTGNVGAWKLLAALSVSLEYFREHYIDNIRDNVCQVEYVFSGAGVHQALEKKIMRYVNSSFTQVKSEQSASGLLFFPSTNAVGTEYKFTYPEAREYKDSKRYHTVLQPTESPRTYAVFNSQSVPITKDMIVNVEEQDLTEYAWKPVTIEPSRTVRLYVKFLGMGLRKREILVKDYFDSSPPYEASELLKTLMIGWTPAYAPTSFVLSDTQHPSRIANFFDFEFHWGVKSDEVLKQVNERMDSAKAGQEETVDDEEE